MKTPYNFICKNPVLSVLSIATIIVLFIPFLYGLLVALCIVLPLYLLNKLFGNN
jgi:hypothetical protein